MNSQLLILLKGVWLHLKLMLLLEHDGSGLPSDRRSGFVQALIPVASIVFAIYLFLGPTDALRGPQFLVYVGMLVAGFFLFAGPLRSLEVFAGMVLLSIFRHIVGMPAQVFPGGFLQSFESLFGLWMTIAQCSLFVRHLRRIERTKKRK
jgi:hypothetical protein